MVHAPVKRAPACLAGAALTELLAERERAFDARFRATFGDLAPAAPNGTPCGAYAVSASSPFAASPYPPTLSTARAGLGPAAC